MDVYSILFWCYFVYSFILILILLFYFYFLPFVTFLFGSILAQNKESCLHAASNYGHTSTVEYLTSIHTSLDLQDVVSHLCFICFYFKIFYSIILSSLVRI